MRKDHERQELNLNYELFHALSFKTAKTQIIHQHLMKYYVIKIFTFIN